MAMVRNDDVPGGKMRDFESAASHLLPCDPVAKRKSAAGTKRDHSLVSEAKLEVSLSTSGKPSIGKTGVEFRYYKKDKFKKLSKEQQEELIEYRKSKNNQPKKKRVKFDSSDS